MLSIFKSLTGLTFISVILEMLMPDGSFKKYIRSIFGIIMLTVLISGITRIKTDFSYGNIADIFSSENVRTDELERLMEQELVLSAEKQIKERIAAEGIEINSISIDFDEENKIKKIRLAIKDSSVFKDKVIKILTDEFAVDEKTVEIGD